MVCVAGWARLPIGLNCKFLNSQPIGSLMTEIPIPYLPPLSNPFDAVHKRLDDQYKVNVELVQLLREMTATMRTLQETQTEHARLLAEIAAGIAPK